MGNDVFINFLMLQSDLIIMKEIIKSLADSVSGIEIEKKLFSTRVSIYGNELKHYTLYFGADASARINDYISKNDAQLLEKLVPVNYGPNMIEVFKALDNSISVFRIIQYVPHQYEPRSEWIISTDARTCHALNNLVSNHK